MDAVRINPKLFDVQNRTIDEIHNYFSSKGKVLTIRPTGFGKTYMLVERISKEFIKENPGKKVIYLYPLDIIKTEIVAGKKYIDDNGKTQIKRSKYLKDGVIKLNGNDANMEFISYQLLSLRFNEDNDYWHDYIIKNNVGLIILDEAHRAGSETFYSIFDTIRDLIKPNGVYMLGATATPDRMDDCDEKPSVLEAVFDNIKTFDYGLNDAIKDGLIPPLVIMHDEYSINVINDKHRAKKNKDKSIAEDSYNLEISKLRQVTGREQDIIASSIEKANYNPTEDKYYKFIIFLTNIEDIANQAEEIEEWFRLAFNNVIKKKYSLKRDFCIRSTYLTSSDTSGELKELASKSNNRTYYNKTEKIENLIEQNYYVDLIFTVNMVNMGYHVDNITGIMMLRATKSEITFYQQLGRALSVNASHNPIVIDSVNNIYEEFWFKKNAKRKDSTIDNGEVDNNKETNNNIKIDIQYLKSYDAFEQFMQRFCTDEYNSEEIELDFLYNDRQMPLFILASYKGITCKELIKKLIQYKINIRKEDEEYNFVYNNCLSLKQSNNKKDTMQEVNKLRFINSKKATYGNCSLIKNKQTTTMYDMLNK